MRIVVGIATTGRRAMLSHTLAHLARQTRRADSILVCPARPDDFDEAAAAALNLPIGSVSSQPGSCHQRNAIIDRAGDADLIVFFDDDFLPSDTFLAASEHLFTSQPDIAVATGRVLADGAHGSGLTIEEGRDILANDTAADAGASPTPTYNAYGCNMVFRMAAIAQGAVRFDEALPLYGWQEDVDFCRRLAPQGRIVLSSSLRGVHLGTKNGRTSGLRFGYSQIANPIYLVGKGSVSHRWALRLMARNMAANMAGSLRPGGMVDRRGRLRGNVLAFRDLLLRRLSPGRILDF
ncbi:MAG: putative glycosyl transferase [Rhodospirillales bacterium]|nr:putative glycosyl transferase [Rhodospirillales bacterium]